MLRISFLIGLGFFSFFYSSLVSLFYNFVSFLSPSIAYEKEFCILINLQRKKYTYLYSSVKAKKEIKLESN